MAIGDTYRKIEAGDQLVFDSAGRLTGVRSGQSGAAEGRMLSEAKALAVDSLVSGAGIVLNSTAAATANTAALNAAMLKAGLIDLNPLVASGAGIAWFNGTLAIPSDTTLSGPPSLRLKLMPNSNCNFFRNKNFNPVDGSGWRAITSITLTTAGDGNLLLTVVSPSHGLTTGAIRLINGALPDLFNNVYEVTVLNVNTFTCSFDTANGDIPTGTTATFRTTSVTGTIAPGSKVVTAVSSVDNLICGSFVTGTGIPAGCRIETINSASQITLTIAATGTGAQTLTCGFPLQHCPADRNIRITGGMTIDWNAANQTSADDLSAYCINFRGISGCVVSNLRMEGFGVTSVQYEGVYDSLIEKLWLKGATNYQSNGPHFDHCGRNVTIKEIYGSTKDDFSSHCQKQYPQYFDAGTPMGDMRTLVLENQYPSTGLSTIKFVPIAGLVFDDIKVYSEGGRTTFGTGINVTYDPVTTGAHITGTRRSIGKVTNLLVSKATLANNPNGTLFFTSADAEFVSFVETNLGNLGVNGHFGVITLTSKVSGLRIAGMSMRSTAAPLLLQLAGGLQKLTISDLDLISANGTFMQHASTADDGTSVFASHVRLDGFATFWQVNGQQNLKLACSRCSHINNTGDWIFPAAFSGVTGTMSDCPDISQTNFVTGGGNNNNGRFTWTGLGVDDLGSGATFAFSGQKHPNKKGTVTQNVTISTPTNLRSGTNMEGYIFTLNLVVSGSGTYTVTFPAEITHPAGFTQPGASANGKRTQLAYIYDGGIQTLRCISGANVWV